jgi:hypothetical protein
MSRWARSQGPVAGTQTRVLLFSASGLPLGVALEEMAGVVEERGVLPLPMAHPALWGVLPNRDGASPVLDLGALMPGQARPPMLPNTERLVVLFPHQGGSVGVRVERLGGLAPGVTPLAEGLQKKLVAALPAGVQGWVTGAATAGGQLFFFFSRDAFLAWVNAQAELGEHTAPG